MDKGCIQLYYGDGKGKTTAAIGQIVRCVGHGFKVLVYQFLKEPTSGEVSVIRSLPGVEYIPNEGPIPAAGAQRGHHRAVRLPGRRDSARFKPE